MCNVGLRCFKAHVENEEKLLSPYGCIDSLSGVHNEIANDDLEGEIWAKGKSQRICRLHLPSRYKWA